MPSPWLPYVLSTNDLIYACPHHGYLVFQVLMILFMHALTMVQDNIPVVAGSQLKIAGALKTIIVP